MRNPGAKGLINIETILRSGWMCPANIQWTVWWAFATRRAESLDAARSILLEAVERHPEAAIFHYNLACYESQLGELEVAKARLRHAIKLNEKYRFTALDDEDLKPLWNLLGGE